MLRNLVAAGVLALAACSSPEPPGGPGGPVAGDAAVFDPALLLVSGQRFEVAALEGQPLPGGVPAWIGREGARLSGNGGCNAITGPVRIRGTSIRLGPLASTRMACPPPAMAAESRLLAAFAQVDGARGTPGGQVELLQGARPLVVLSPAR